MYMYEEEVLVSALSGLFTTIPSLLLSVATYVLTALTLQTMAKRRGLNKPWLAWIPVANVWLLGSLSDQYRYVVKGEEKSKRKILLTLGIVTAVLSITILILAGVVMVQALMGAAGYVSEHMLVQQIMGPTIGMLGLCLPLLGVTIAYAIIRYMALYDVYKSMDPANCVLFLVLSIIFSVTEPFFLFFNRHKDLGMPPRRQEPVYMPPQQEWQQPSWDGDRKDYL